MSIFSNIASYFRMWRLKKRRQTVVIRGSCNLCGQCCREVCLYVGSKWLRTEKQHRKEAIENPYLNHFKPIGKTDDGFLKFTCTRLNENGTCSDYKGRPLLCKRFPTTSIYFQHGQLPKGCGFRMSTEMDFEKLLDDARENDDGLEYDEKIHSSDSIKIPSKKCS